MELSLEPMDGRLPCALSTVRTTRPSWDIIPIRLCPDEIINLYHCRRAENSDTRQKGLVYAIAPYCDAAIFAAGHAGNGAFWINPTTGKWSGTTYYGEFPWWASQYNDRQAIDSRISSVTWEPVFPRGMYTFLPDWRDVVFKYKFDDDRNNKFRRHHQPIRQR